MKNALMDRKKGGEARKKFLGGEGLQGGKPVVGMNFSLPAKKEKGGLPPDKGEESGGDRRKKTLYQKTPGEVARNLRSVSRGWA